MSQKFVLPIDELDTLKFNTKTGVLEIEVPMYLYGADHPALNLCLQFSEGAARGLALTLAQAHKFLDEQIEGKPVTNALQ